VPERDAVERACDRTQSASCVLATSSTTDKVDAVRTWALPFLLLLAGTVSDRAQTPQPLSRDAALLETALKLSSEPEPEFGADGSRSFVWTGAEGPGTTLIIRDLTPSGRPGVMIKLLLMKPRA